MSDSERYSNTYHKIFLTNILCALYETFVNTIRLLWLHAIAKFETNPAMYREVTKHLVQLLKSSCIETEVTWPLNYNLYQVKSQRVNRSELLYTRAILFKAGRRNSFVFDISGNENVSRVQFTQYSVLQVESGRGIAANHMVCDSHCVSVSC